MIWKWKLRPCNGCRQRGACPQMECARWREWFLDAWEGISRKAVSEARLRNRLSGDRLFYGMPHEAVDPCEKCAVRRICDVPCQRRLWWWDHQMAIIRRRNGQ